MTRTHNRTARALVCLAACMLLAVFSAQATASKEPSSAGRGFGFVYDPAHEVTLVGTVAGIVTHPARGTPMGMHVLFTSSGKTVDAHVGPFLSKQNVEALKNGRLIQVTGVNATFSGKNVLVARTLIIDGREVTLRNEHGFMIQTSTGPRRAAKKSANGGTR